jgi:hypothetical protein
MTTLCLDPFTRTTSPGLGNEPVTGNAYQSLPASTDWSTTGTVARAVTAVVNTLYYSTVDTASPDQVVKVTTTVPVLPATAPITVRVVGRWTDVSNYYEAQLSVSTAGTATLAIQKRVAGVLTTVTTTPASVNAGTHVAGNAWTVVLEIFGSTLRARAWNATSGADPVSWQLTGTDTSLTAGTRAGFGVRRETGNTNGTQNIDFDNFTVDTLLTVISQNVWPARTLVAVSGLSIGDSVAIYRVVSGARTLVQNGSTVSVTDVAFLRVDAELPFGVPVYYVAVINNDETDSAPVVYTLTGGKVALTDAISGLAAEVVIWAWPNKRRPRQATVFKPGGRNVVVSGPMGQFEADVEVYTETTSSAENLVDLLDGATQGIIQVRQAGPYDDIDCHAVVTDHTPRRYAQDGSDQKRIHALHLVEVSGWASALAATGFTYQDLSDTYVGLTYANLSADFATYLLLAQGDFS